MEVIDNKGVVYSSVREFCRRVGVSRTHVIEQMRSKGYYTNKRRGIELHAVEAPVVAPVETNKVWQELQARYSPEELSLLCKGEGLSDKSLRYPKVCLRGKHHKIGVISDGHLGSKYSPLEWHYAAFKEFEEQGCECVLHAGDLVEGLTPRRISTQIYELTHIGYKAQRDLAIEVYSRCRLPIYAISGNHDMYFNEFAGANIVEDICNAVPNMTYLGHDQADIEFDGATVRLFHGSDGSCFTEGTEILTKEHGVGRF